jgi:hypothetical protein
MKKECVLTIIAFVVIVAACKSLSPEGSAHAKIITKAGKSLYVNRLARGNNYDAIWITTSSGACRTPSDDDVVLGKTYDSAELYYKLMPDGSVLLFLPWSIPIPEEFSTIVKYEEIHIMDWGKIKQRYETGEISYMKLELPQSDPCTFRWTEIRDLFRGNKQNN